MNRLAKEKSPYLKMHRDNPVDWYPWSDEAFSEAKRQDKPILLSIGYSSCHWCHVIARESFSDDEVARLLNESFISIKVDKEERPDVDQVYMDAVELATGSGGWPMTILTTPDAEPFFAATYLPRTSRGGMAGMVELLEWARDAWANRRCEVVKAARELTASMREVAGLTPRPAEVAPELTKQALAVFERDYDREWGGFGRAPKFPQAQNILFLLAHYENARDGKALDMAIGTLEHMYSGGIFDHIGGGFCRYSVDRIWLVPHFEKMLYDNALLIWAYSEAWRITGKSLYRDVARRTIDYVLREMTGDSGEFFCSQDADSEGVEGAFYLFTPDEIETVLLAADAQLFCRAYGITPKGNFEGKSIPNLLGGTQVNEDKLEPLRRKVYEYRRGRMALNRDDKVLTSWSALMICALAAAYKALGDENCLRAALRAEKYLSGRWDGAGVLGVLSDYALYALALLMLFDATGERSFLEKSVMLAEQVEGQFRDTENGGYFLYSNRAEQLITRPKDVWDSAMPSGNSAMALVLHDIARFTGDDKWLELAQRQLRFVAGAAKRHPTACGFSLYAVSLSLAREFTPAI